MKGQPAHGRADGGGGGARGGLRTQRRISHVFVMDVPTYHKVLIVTDGAINIAPDLGGQGRHLPERDRSRATRSARAPKVAILAAVETVHSKMPATLDAAALCKMANADRSPAALLDGPSRLRQRHQQGGGADQGHPSEVAGDPDILPRRRISRRANILAKQLAFLANADGAGLCSARACRSS
jgi:phosphotransacetylase